MISKGIIMIIIGIAGSLLSLFLLIRTLRKPLTVPEYHQEDSETNNLPSQHEVGVKGGSTTQTLAKGESIPISETIELQPISIESNHAAETVAMNKERTNTQSKSAETKILTQAQTSETRPLTTNKSETQILKTELLSAKNEGSTN